MLQDFLTVSGHFTTLRSKWLSYWYVNERRKVGKLIQHSVLILQYSLEYLNNLFFVTMLFSIFLDDIFPFCLMDTVIILMTILHAGTTSTT